MDLSRLPDQNRPASPPYSKPHPQTQKQPNHLMNDSTTDFIAELQEAHRMHADGCTEHRIRKMLKRSGAPTSLTEHILQITKSKSPRDNDRWVDWLDPFIDSLTPTPEIKSAHGTARQILDHYHDATLKAVKARNHTDRRNAELSWNQLTGNSNSPPSRPATPPPQIQPPPDTSSATLPPSPSTPPRTPHDSGHRNSPISQPQDPTLPTP